MPVQWDYDKGLVQNLLQNPTVNEVWKRSAKLPQSYTTTRVVSCCFNSHKQLLSEKRLTSSNLHTYQPNDWLQQLTTCITFTCIMQILWHKMVDHCRLVRCATFQDQIIQLQQPHYHQATTSSSHFITDENNTAYYYRINNIIILLSIITIIAAITFICTNPFYSNYSLS